MFAGAVSCTHCLTPVTSLSVLFGLLQAAKEDAKASVPAEQDTAAPMEEDAAEAAADGAAEAAADAEDVKEKSVSKTRSGKAAKGNVARPAAKGKTTSKKRASEPVVKSPEAKKAKTAAGVCCKSYLKRLTNPAPDSCSGAAALRPCPQGKGQSSCVTACRSV